MRNKNNVLQVINLFGSARSFIGDQFSYLNENGYKMHLICSPSEELESFANKQNIKYKAVILNRQVTPWQDLKALIIICLYIKRNNIQVVIAHQAKARLLAMIASTLMGVPHKIIFAHGVLYETMTGIKRKMVKLNDKFVSYLSDKVVCVSNSVMAKRLIDNIDNPNKQIILGKGTANGVDALSKFNPKNVSSEATNILRCKLSIDKDSFVIGFCGRLVKDKGIIELLEAFDKIVMKYPDKDIKLLIVGQFEKRDSIPLKTIDYLQNSKKIIFTGSVPYSNIQKYYTLMNVFILPSYREGFPTVVLEASSMSLPVIVSKSTGCIDSIDENKTGVYIDIEPISIVKAIEKFFDPVFANNIGQNGREFVLKNYDHTIVRKHVLDLLSNITNN